MKVETSFVSTYVPASYMNIGDIAIVQDDEVYRGTILLRAFDQHVSLNNPSETWRAPKFTVSILPVGSVITLTITDKEKK